MVNLLYISKFFTGYVPSLGVRTSHPHISYRGRDVCTPRYYLGKFGEPGFLLYVCTLFREKNVVFFSKQRAINIM